MDNQINDIPGFFRVQFAAAAGRSLPPTPQHCCGPVALSRWNSRGDVDNHETVEDRQLQFSLEQ
ncbi:MAG: hypothetical protein KDA71_15990, partial [Planctomycetales bacterium]|nr:hypothetical protein [Planctomycetales bacterium]